METGYFYTNIEENEKITSYLKAFKDYSNSLYKQVYIIDEPLNERKYTYDYKDFMILLIPNYKILLIDNAETICLTEGFESFYEDFIEDLGYISDKYGYKKILGRPREWKDKYIVKLCKKDVEINDISSFLEQYKLNAVDSRNVEFLISLLTGSINEVDRVGDNYPQNLLDKVKQKIILFDADQTKFIYNDLNQKRITIQGLAGTGKTELLLHKLKEIYTKHHNSKIVFTCFNRILADNMKTRIPDFFDFMKVEEQIKWNERLWVMRSWGSLNDMNSGVYSYICQYYDLDFRRYSRKFSFSDVCKEAFLQLKKQNETENLKPCFDYMLIDESQDFSEEFFKLCEIVTKHKIYVAGDIFQNVFDVDFGKDITPDFLLNKCYRTDPRTLMFAHAVGMGLFDKKLRWLSDDEWKACGYKIDKKRNMYTLSRPPLRRFEDLKNENVDSVKLSTSNTENYASDILGIVKEIIYSNPTVKPDDIGIVFLENSNDNYKLVDKLEILIDRELHWQINKGYETKIKTTDTLFVSNKNNIKGLEFPFVICVTTGLIRDNLVQRNSIYMMLTRSFISSYFIVSDYNDPKLLNLFKKGIEEINSKGCIEVTKPSDGELEKLNHALINSRRVNKTQKEVIEEILDNHDIFNMDSRKKLAQTISVLLGESMDEDAIERVIEANKAIL